MSKRHYIHSTVKKQIIGPIPLGCMWNMEHGFLWRKLLVSAGFVRDRKSLCVQNYLCYKMTFTQNLLTCVSYFVRREGNISVHRTTLCH